MSDVTLKMEDLLTQNTTHHNLWRSDVLY